MSTTTENSRTNGVDTATRGALLGCHGPGACDDDSRIRHRGGDARPLGLRGDHRTPQGQPALFPAGSPYANLGDSSFGNYWAVLAATAVVLAVASYLVLRRRAR